MMRRGRHLIVPIVLMPVVLCCSTSTGVAHDFQITRVQATLEPDGRFSVDLRVDIDALALGVSPSIPSAELAEELGRMSPDELQAAMEQARGTLRRRVRIRFDGARVPLSVTFPEYDAPPATPPEEPSVLGTIARLSGEAPDSARVFRFGASRAFNAVELRVTRGGGQPIELLLGPGENSPDIPLDMAEPVPADNIFVRYVGLGFEHIVPLGMDHMLFVLGLFLLSARWRPLLWQVSAFTVAHTLTLGLSMTYLPSLSPRIVETLIALSIAYVAIENLVLDELKPWRTGLVFLFGLLHGMGFAGVLQELGLPRGHMVQALIGFNIGVELGQLAVIAAAFASVGWYRHAKGYRARVVRPTSVIIGLIGLYWAVERAIG